MKSIFDYKFKFYTSKMNEICLYYHWLYFSSMTMSFGQGGEDLLYHLSSEIHCILSIRLIKFFDINKTISRTQTLQIITDSFLRHQKKELFCVECNHKQESWCWWCWFQSRSLQPRAQHNWQWQQQCSAQWWDLPVFCPVS